MNSSHLLGDMTQAPQLGARLCFSWFYSVRKGLPDSHFQPHKNFLTELYLLLAKRLGNSYHHNIYTVSGETYTSHYKDYFVCIFLNCLEVLVINMYKPVKVTVCQTHE